MAKKFFWSCNVYPLTLYHQTLNTDKYEKSVIHVAYTVSINGYAGEMVESQDNNQDVFSDVKC